MYVNIKKILLLLVVYFLNNCILKMSNFIDKSNFEIVRTHKKNYLGQI